MSPSVLQGEYLMPHEGANNHQAWAARQPCSKLIDCWASWWQWAPGQTGAVGWGAGYGMDCWACTVTSSLSSIRKCFTSFRITAFAYIFPGLFCHRKQQLEFFMCQSWAEQTSSWDNTNWPTPKLSKVICQIISECIHCKAHLANHTLWISKSFPVS